MQNTKFLKMFAAGLAVMFVGALYAGYDEYPYQYAQNQIPEHIAPTSDVAAAIHQTVEPGKAEVGKFSLTKGDVDVSLSGGVTQKWMGYHNIYTLRSHNNDQQGYLLGKGNLCLDATVGRQMFGESAADARLELLSRGVWRRSDGSRIDYLEAHMNQVWINFHLGVFYKPFGNWFSLKDYPIDVKMGWFPYELGRGITLGHGQTEAWYMGFSNVFDSNTYLRDIDRRDLIEPGILLHGAISKDITYDLYYSRHTERGLTYGGTNPTKTQGVAKDRDIFAGRMDFMHERGWGNLHAQPYMMYMDESHSYLGTNYFGAIRLGTVGLMLNYEKNKFCMGAEAAGQYGHLAPLYDQSTDYPRVNLRGIMGLVDAKYSFETVPMSVAVAAAHISGDHDPRRGDTPQTSIRHRGFVPYGDGNYVGKFVNSQIMLEARKLPRPLYRPGLTGNNRLLTVERETMHNLQYLGMGTCWKPFSERERLVFESNALFFWESTTMPKWNRGSGVGDYGTLSDNDASRFLGTELNFDMKYRPLSNCCLMAQLACFIPGQLYKDVDGWRVSDTNYQNIPSLQNQGVYGLGHNHVWRGALMASFEF